MSSLAYRSRARWQQTSRLAFLLAFTACSSSGPSADGGSPDTGLAADLGAIDGPAGDTAGVDVLIADAAGTDAIGPDTAADLSVSPSDAGLDAGQDAAVDGAQAGGQGAALTCASCAPGLKACNDLCGSLGGARHVCIGCVTPSPRTGCNGNCYPCSFPHASAAAACGPDGACAMGACDNGWADCDGNAANGCETDLHNPNACGCSAGQCQPSTCMGTMCGDQCTDVSTDPLNCGACGHSCLGANSSKGGARTDECVGGTCYHRCGPGHSLCGDDCVSLANDAANCGTCGHACATGQVCVEGDCMATASLHLAEGLTDPVDLAVDADSVYWTDPTAGTVSRVSKNGGAVVVLADKQASPARVALDDTHVYWSNALGAAIMRAPKGGGAAQMVTAAVTPTELTVVGGAVYYLSNTGMFHDLYKVPAGGGAAVKLVGCSFDYDSGSGVPFDPAAAGVTMMVRDGATLFVACPRAVRQYVVLEIDTAHADAMKSVDGAALHRGPVLAVSGRYFFHLAGGTSTSLVWFDKETGAQGGRLTSDVVIRREALPGQATPSACGLFYWSTGVPPGDFALFSSVSGTAVTIQRGAQSPRHTVSDGKWIFWTEKNAVGKMPIP